ncbi:MAG: C1 family peptidase [Spirochaetota bacterium]
MCRRTLTLALLFPLASAGFADEPAEGYLPEPLELIEKIPVSDTAFLRHRGLPSAVDLSRDFPTPGNQGKQGSCVGFATTYAIKTYYERRKRKWDVSTYENIFSPAWTYNQINKGRDRGAHIPHALELLVQKGAVPWSVMPYNANDFRTQPNQQQRQMALQYRAKSYEQVPVDNVEALKAELARGNPMAIGVYTGVDRRNCCRNNEVFDQFTQKRFMGHAMVLVGYDDRKVSPRGHRGAFKLMDSGGTQVGTGGFGWVSYEFAPQLLYAAYVLRDGDASLPVQPAEPGLLPPTHVHATQGRHSDKVVVTWQKAAGATAYEIERSTAGDFQFISIGYSGTSSFEDTAVQEDVAYDYRVLSIRDRQKTDREQSMIAKGYAATKAKAEAVPPLLPPVIAARPGRVENLSASTGIFAGKIVLTWDSVPGAGKYWIVRFDRSTGTWKELAWATKNRYEDSSPEAVSGASQAYSVRAANATEVGDAAAPVWGAANPNASRATAIPDTPKDVRAGLKGNKVSLEWKAVEKADEYYVFRRRFDTPAWVHAATVKQARFSENFPGSAGELWYYIVRAKSSSGGESAESALAAVTMNAQRPVIRARYTTENELAAFTGKWTAEIAAAGKMESIALDITSSGDNFSVTLTAGPRSKKLSGKYVARSHELGFGGLSIKRVAGNAKLLSVTCRDRSLCGTPFRDTLQRVQ